MLRILNAGLGLIGAPLALVATLGLGWRHWRREGDDPELTDSPSILMAGPPAEMTPALATVITNGTATGHSINTILAQLASTGRLSFHNLDQVSEARSDVDPDPLTDPAIEVHAGSQDDRELAGPEREAWERIRQHAGGSGLLTRERLWEVNPLLNSSKRALESEAVRIGWLARMPGPSITTMVAIGVGLAVIGAVAIFIGISVPMSGAVMLGAALVLGGIGTIGFGMAMSQRTSQGAYVDAMLKAYRRTLQKTMDQARSMSEVVEQPEIAKLADTPDKAVVWGMALGLHREVAALLARGLEAQRARHRLAGRAPTTRCGSARRRARRGPAPWRHGRRPRRRRQLRLRQRLLGFGDAGHRRHVRRARQRRVHAPIVLLVERRRRRVLRRRQLGAAEAAPARFSATGVV